jgi:hypothetical protein
MKSIQINPTSELHKKLVSAVIDRKKFSQRKMNEFQKQWDAADESLKAYIPEKDADRLRRGKKEFSGKVDYITLEVPYAYAQVMTAHTYWSTVFLSRQPVWQFSGRHGETQDSVDAVEAVHDYQLRVGEMLPVLYNWLYDWARYSLGIVGVYWDHEKKVVSEMIEEAPTLLGVPIPGMKPKLVRKEREVDGYVGNRLYNIRPYDWFPDPRVPIWKFQEGEFVIRETSEGWSDLIACSQANPGYYINIDYLQKKISEKRNNAPMNWNPGSHTTNLPLTNEEAALDQPEMGFVRTQEMYIKLVPSQWGLGDSKRVQKYVITLADECTVISCKPLGYLHDMFPFAITEGNFGSDSFAKTGLLEIIKPMTDVLTWLVNSHFYNVRKTLNDTRIVDPTAVVLKDVEEVMKGAGGVIRLKPGAYGRDVRTFLMQLQNGDATRSHIADLQVIERMVQTTSGVMENLMGNQSSSSRKSATEARISANYAGNRLKTPAEYNSAIGFMPLGKILVSNTQQLLDLERKYAIAGNMTAQAKRFMEVNPQSIAGFYDFVPIDGTSPIDPLAKATFWKELILGIAKDPRLAMGWDINEMISHMMKIQGERNVDRFRIQVLPPGAMPNPNATPVGVAPNVTPINAGRPGAAKPPGTSGGTV